MSEAKGHQHQFKEKFGGQMKSSMSMSELEGLKRKLEELENEKKKKYGNYSTFVILGYLISFTPNLTKLSTYLCQASGVMRLNKRLKRF